MADGIYYEVATLIAPAAEPFAVVRVDTAKRMAGGVEGRVQSLHWAKEKAQQVADQLNLRGETVGHG